MHLIVRHNSASSGGDVISLMSDRSFSSKYSASIPPAIKLDRLIGRKVSLISHEILLWSRISQLMVLKQQVNEEFKNP